MDPAVDAELYERTVLKLRTVEEEHMAQEEQWFQQLRVRMSENELAALQDRLEFWKKVAPTHPWARAPNGKYTSRLTHPVAGLIDKVWDRFRG
jgi:hypothetical protein